MRYERDVTEVKNIFYSFIGPEFSTHMVAHKYLQFPFQGSRGPLWPLWHLKA